MNARNVVIVGGSHGIGWEIVRRELEVGSSVTVVSRTEGRLTEFNHFASSSLQHIPLDITETAIPEDRLPEQIDGFVYCPGSINLGSLRSVKAETMRKDFELNVVSAMSSFQVALKGLQRSPHASALFFSTIAVQRGIPMHTSVAAAKGAIEALVRTWAAELAPKVRVNGIAPALIDTPLAERLLQNEAKRTAMAAQYPLGRFGQPDDCASLAEFLLSEKSSWITGQIFGVDGGLSSGIKFA